MLFKQILQQYYPFTSRNGAVSEIEFRELLALLEKTPNISLDNWDINKLDKNIVINSKYSTLNLYEAFLIGRYADLMASQLNKELRNTIKSKDEGLILYEYLLNKSLRKLPSESDTTVYVMYRADGADDELYKWYQNRIGDTIQFPNFLSSSRKKWSDFGFYLQIKTCNKSSGKYIGPLTNKEELESEVLFSSNTKFRITSVDREKETIFLSELPRKHQGNYLLTDFYYRNILKDDNQ